MTNLLKTVCILVIVLLPFLYSCDDSPTAPADNEEPVDSIPPADTLKSWEVELWALAPVASWEYKTHYFYNQYTSTGDNEKLYHYGKLTIYVKGIDITKRQFIVETQFIIDSLYYSYHDDFLHLRDTAYTVYNGDPNIPSFSDSVMEYTLVLERDTLWCVEEENLVFMMPRKFISNGSINLATFFYPGIKQFVAEEINFIRGRVTDTGYKYGAQLLPDLYTSVEFVSENGCFTILEIVAGWAGISGCIEEIKYELLYYEPGQPIE